MNTYIYIDCCSCCCQLLFVGANSRFTVLLPKWAAGVFGSGCSDVLSFRLAVAVMFGHVPTCVHHKGPQHAQHSPERCP